MTPRTRVLVAAVLVAAIAASGAIVWWQWPAPDARPMPLPAGEPWAVEPGAAATIRGTVTTDAAADALTVSGCGSEAVVDAAGAFGVAAAPGRCTLEPSADVGGWHAVGEAVEVDVPGQIAIAFVGVHAVVVRDAVTAMLVGFVPEGLRVQAIDDATARRLGIEVGTVITGVDGVELAGLGPIGRLRAAQAMLVGTPVLGVSRP
jgi:hypothetical protein